MANPQNTTGRKLFMGRIPQADYNTPTPFVTSAPYNHVQVLLLAQDPFFDFQVNTVDNEDVATGSDIPTDQYVTRHDVKGSGNPYCDADSLARFLFGALGTIVTSTPAAGIKRHAITPVNAETTVQLPVFSFIEKVGFYDVLYPSCVIDKVSLQGEGETRIKMGVQVIGSGKRTTPSTLALSGGGQNAALASGLAYFKNTQAQITLADAGTLSNSADVGCKLKSWSLDLDNAHDADNGYLPGCGNWVDANDKDAGIARSRCFYGKRKYVPKFMVEADADNDYIAALKTQKPLDFLITMTGPKIATVATVDYFYYAKLRGHLTRYSAIQVGQNNNLLTYEITPKLLMDSNGNWFSAEVQNAMASYTS